MSVPSQKYVRNRLLAALDAADYDAVQALAAPVGLRRMDLLIKADQPIRHVDFIESGVASAVSVTPRGRRSAIGVIGNEGFVGVPLLLAVDRTPHEVFVQVEGEALRLDIDGFRTLLEARPGIRLLLSRYAHVFQVQTADTAQSNGCHSLEERVARWLLMCHDRIEGDEFPVTHEVLAMLLGVRRPGVTTTMHILAGAGMIKTRRSHIQVVDREKLKRAAGDSYGVPEEEYRRLIKGRR